MGKRVQKLLIYIFIRVSRDVVVPPRPLVRMTVPRARPVVKAWHVIFLISGFFDSLFLADSGGEEQDDWLLG